MSDKKSEDVDAPGSFEVIDVKPEELEAEAKKRASSAWNISDTWPGSSSIVDKE